MCLQADSFHWSADCFCAQVICEVAAFPVPCPSWSAWNSLLFLPWILRSEVRGSLVCSPVTTSSAQHFHLEAVIKTAWWHPSHSVTRLSSLQAMLRHILHRHWAQVPTLSSWSCLFPLSFPSSSDDSFWKNGVQSAVISSFLSWVTEITQVSIVLIDM